MGSSARRLQFHDGKFRIMQISDVQELAEFSPDTVRLLEGALEREQPDLVVLTGDQIKGYSPNFLGKQKAQYIRQAIDTLLAPVVKRNIPFAVTFGNHDRQAGLSNAEQLEFYKKHAQYVPAAEHVFDPGTCCIPVYDGKGEKPVFAAYLIDSQGDAKGGGYEPVKPEQIAWYRETRNRLEAEHGACLPAMVFQHIPLPEYYNALEQAKRGAKGAIRMYRTHKGEYYRLGNPGEDEHLREPVCSPDINTGEFEALQEKGDVFGVFCGHDHKNCFVRPYRGIDLGYTPSAGFHEYGPGADRGVRMIELREADPRQYRTYMVTFRNLFGGKLEHPVRDFLYRHFPSSMDQALFWLRNAGLVLLAAAAVTGLLIFLLK
ncbi:MAG: metallophosphoesterase family protein [Clostridiales bacterium]|nr:metallophosphoesterase family protein [Clostridiales bacterium]